MTTYLSNYAAKLRFVRAVWLVVGLLAAGISSGWCQVVTAAFTSPTDIPVTATSYSAAGQTLNLTLNFAPAQGTVLTVVKNIGLSLIDGEFSNLSHGQLVRLAYGGLSYGFVANYFGGTGNDLVLQWAKTRAVSWGDSSRGEGGAGHNNHQGTPVAVVATGVLSGKTILALVGGNGHSLALCSDGTVAAWGDNSWGQLGDGTTTSTNIPVLVSGGALNGERVVALAAGYEHSVALCASGRVVAWGKNDRGQLGDNGTLTTNPLPVSVRRFDSVLLAPAKAVAIAAGQNHTLALRGDGTVWAWGDNGKGQLGGFPMGYGPSWMPTEVNSAGASALANKTVLGIAANNANSLAYGDTWVATWGDNTWKQLGNAAAGAVSNLPVAVEAGAGSALQNQSIVAATLGLRHALVLLADGKLATWGDNSYGQLGNGTDLAGVEISTPTVFAPTAGSAFGDTARVPLALGSGFIHNLVVCANGQAVSWGYNASGQLGRTTSSVNNGTPGVVSMPTDPALAGARFLAVNGGQAFHSLGIVALPDALPEPLITSASTAAGTVGVTFAGYTVTAIGSPTSFAASGLPLGLAINATSGEITGTPTVAGTFSVTLTASNTVGTSTATLTLTITMPAVVVVTAAFSAATDVPVTAASYTASGKIVNLSLNFAPPPGTILRIVNNTGRAFIQGKFSNLAQGQEVLLTYGGQNYVFIANYYGGTGNDLVLLPNVGVFSLGLNTNGQGNVPSGLSRVVGLAGGFYHSVAVKSDGTVVTWGGATGPANISPPSGLSGVVAVAAGGDQTLALKSDGTVVGWGYDLIGSFRLTTVPAGLSEVVAIDIEEYTAMALKEDGSVVTWGYGGTSNVSGAVAIAAGSSHYVALKSDGTVVVWGDNHYGQTEVPSGLSGITAVAAGAYHTVALKSDGTVVAWGLNGNGQCNVPSGLSGVVAIEATGLGNVAMKSDGTAVSWGSYAPVPTSGPPIVGFAGGSQHVLYAVELPAISSPATASATFDEIFNGYTVTARNAPTSFNASGLPPGLALNVITGAITGRPTAAGTYTVELTASNALGTSLPFSLSFVVAKATQGIAFGSLPAKLVGDMPLTLAATASSGLPVSYISTNPVVATVSGDIVTIHDFGSTEIVARQSGDSNYSAAADVSQTLTVSAPPFTAPTTVLLTTSAYTAEGKTISLSLGYVPVAGTILTAISNKGHAFIEGRFTNLAQGEIVALMFEGKTYSYIANYYGGSGNDLVLQPANLRLATWGKSIAAQPSELSSLVAVAGGGSHTVALKSDATVVAWGDNTYQQTAVPNGLSGVVAIAAGDQHTLALKGDGTVVGWGDNSVGQINVPNGLTNVVAFEGGFYHSVALKSDGTVVAWGENSNGRTSVPGSLSGVVAIAAGLGHTLALKSDGTVVAWGESFYGETAVPAGLTGVVAIAAGRYHSVALKSDGSVVAWGDNNARQCDVPAGLSGVRAIAAGDSHTVALRADGTVAAWGRNTFQQTQVPTGLSGVASIAAGGNHTLALSDLRPVITSVATASGSVAAAFNGYTVTASNSPTGFAATGLPDGLTINTSTGVITGTPTAGGTYPVTLTAIGADGWSAPFTLIFTVNKLPQTISFGTLPEKKFGDAPYTLTATATSGEAVTYSSSNPGVASVTGNTVTIRALGTTTITARQSGNSAYAAALDVTQTLTVNKGDQVIAFGALAVKEQFDLPFTISAIASSGLPVSFTSSNPSVATVSGNTVTILSVGATTITARQSGSENYNAALDVTRTLTITAPANLAATFTDSNLIRITAERYVATGRAVDITLGFTPSPGAALTLVKNTGAGPIQGEFSNLVHNQLLTLFYGGSSYNFVANYYAGTGNDLVLEWAASRGRATGRNVNTNVPVSMANGVRTMCSGGVHTMYVKVDGTLWAAGGNNKGQLGDGTNTDRAQPVQVATQVKAVAAGTYYTMFIKTDGTLWAMGDNWTGQLGDGTFAARNTPVQISSDVTAVSAGNAHTMFIKSDGTLWAMGGNDNGQLGDGTTVFRARPVLVASNVAAVVCGFVHSLFTKLDGTLWSVGWNAWGQLGTNFGVDRSLPLQIADGVQSFAAGSAHSLWVKRDGTLNAVGYNQNGQLGDGTNQNRGSAVQIATDVRLVGAGYEHSAFVKNDGTLWTFGENGAGELGDGTWLSRNSPVQVATNVANILLGASSKTTLFIDGVPIHIPSINSSATAIGTYGTHFVGYTVTASNSPTSFAASGLPPGLALNSSTGAITGTPTAAGTFVVTLTVENADGPSLPFTLTVMIAKAPQTITFAALEPKEVNISLPFTLQATATSGLGVTFSASNPSVATVGGSTVTINGAGSTTITATQAGDANYLPATAVSQTLSVYPFASTVEANFTAATTLPVTAEGYKAAGRTLNLTLGFAPAPGTILTVVKNTAHAFIDGQFSNLAQGQNVALPFGGQTFNYVAHYYGGTGNDLVLMPAGLRIVGWGDNNSGKIDAPTGLTGVVGIATGLTHAVALRSNGTVVAWGQNASGETTVPNNLSGVVAVAAGSWHTLALKSDGGVVAWGPNFYGQTDVPSGISGIVAIAAGHTHSMALKSDGSVVAWGDNFSGQCTVPTGLSGIVAIAAGHGYSVALKNDGTVVAWGRNTSGETTVPNNLSGVVAIAAGVQNTLALRTDGTVVAFGNVSVNTPPIGLSEVAAIEAGYARSVALKRNGTLVEWGSISRPDWVVPPTLSGVAAVSSREYTTLALVGSAVPSITSPTITSGALGAAFSGYAVSATNAASSFSAAGLPPGLTINATTGAISGTPTAAGIFVVSVSAANEVGISAPLTLTITIAGQSQTITFDPLAAKTVDDAPFTLNAVASSGLAVSYTSSDPSVATVSGATVTIVGAGTTTITASQAGNGNYSAASDVAQTLTVSGPIEAVFTTASTVPRTTNGFTATGLSVNLSLAFAPPTGTVLTVVKNTALGFINGRFTNLAQGQSVALTFGGKTYDYFANYYGGTGNDLTLVPARSYIVAWGQNPYGVTRPPTLSGVVAIAVGTVHAVALKSDGTVSVWGDGSGGQRDVPPGLDGVVQIAAGGYQSFALKNDGSLVGWGSFPGPVTVPSGLSGVVAVTAGISHAVALKSDGTVVAWGLDPLGSTTDVPAALGGVVAVAAGDYHTLALRNDGTVVAWGRNNSDYNQTVVPTGLGGVVAVAAGAQHSLALKDDGTVVAWGSNWNGAATPPAGLSNVTAIAAGNGHSMALKRDGTVVSWGQIAEVETPPPSGLNGVFGVSAGASFEFALVEPVAPAITGSATASGVFGADFSGYTVAATNLPTSFRATGLPGGLGINVSSGEIRGTPLQSGTFAVTLYAANAGGTSAPFSLTLTIAPGSLTALINTEMWAPIAASNVDATGSTISLSLDFAPAPGMTLAAVFSATGVQGRFTNLAQGQLVSLAYDGRSYDYIANYHGLGGFGLELIPANNRIVAWGQNSSGQTVVPAELSGVIGVAAGALHGVALKRDGTVTVWGDGSLGQKNVPAGLNGVVQVAASGNHTLALKSDGTVVGWGSNTEGQTTIPAGLTGVAAISTGPNHSVALKRDGTLVAWGSNTQGQTAIPVGLPRVWAISVGGDHTLALLDSSLVTWGRNDFGQASVPPDILQYAITAVAAGTLHSLALYYDGTVIGWGDNTAGAATPPVGLSDVVAIAAGNAHSMALKRDGTVVSWGRGTEGQTTPPAGLSGVFAISAGSAFQLALSESAAPTISSAATASATVGAPFGGYTITATYSPTSFGATGLPPGLTLNALTGAITGTPSAVGAFPVTLTASNFLGSSAPFTLTISVSKVAQTISFGLLAPKRVADAPFALTATASSGLPVSFTSSNAAVATVSGSTVTLVGEGISTITAYQTGNANYGAAVDVAQVLEVSASMPTLAATFASGTTVPVTANGYIATGRMANLFLGFAPAAGAVLTVVKNTALGFIEGRFTNLAQGQAVALTFGGQVYNYIAHYYGGTGNDLVLIPADTQIVAWGTSPVPVPSGLSSVVALAAGVSHSAAVKADGTVATWGSTQFQIEAPVGLSGVVAVAVGGSQTVALRSDGSVVGWGNSGYGAEVPDGLSGVVGLAAGFGHTVALKSNGTVVAWGNNNQGQTNVPTNLSGVVAIAAGTTHTVALKSDGTVVAWGDNSSGQADVPAGLSGVVGIAAGGGHTAALKNDGTVVAWGYGQYQIAPPGNLSGIGSISAGYAHTAALKSDGTVVAWGSNDWGQSEVPNGLSGVVAITAGGVNTLALKGSARPAITGPASSSGTYAAIYGGYTITATNAPTSFSATGLPAGLSLNANSGAITGVPTAVGIFPVALAATNAIGTSVPFTLTLTIAKGSQTITFDTLGAKMYGNAPFTLGATASSGLAVSYASSNPAVATVSGSTVTLVGVGTTTITASQSGDANYLAAADVTQVLSVASADITASLASAGTVPVTANGFRAAGRAIMLSLGFAPSAGKILMVVNNTGLGFIDGQFSNLAQGQAVALTFGGQTYNYFAHYYGGTGNDLVLVPANLRILGWGDNLYGQTDAPTGLSGVIGLAAGHSHSVALKSDGTLLIWGDTLFGKGDVPAGLSGVVALAAGSNHTIALKSDGTVAAWGSNSYGQTNVPAGLAGVVAIAAGAYHSMALKNDGTVVAWGRNADGQLNVPAGLFGVVAIAGGYGHSTALKSDGTVVVWGSEGYDVARVPAGLSGVVAIAARSIHTVALKSDSTIVAWGSNEYGESNVPAGLTGVAAITAGNAQTLALKSDGTVVAWGTVVNNSAVPPGLSNVAAITAGDFFSLALVGEAPPAITSPAMASGSLGAAFSGYTVTATNSPLSFSATGLPPGLTFNATTGAIIGTPTAAGTFAATVTATNATGSSVPMTLTFMIAKGAQTISFPALAAKYVGDAPFTLSATASSGLAVSYSSSNPAVATVSGNTVTIRSAGSTTITATQGGNENYFAATDISRSLSVGGPLDVVCTAATTAVITSNGYTAAGRINVTLGFAPMAGAELTLVKNTGAGFIDGAFLNLVHNQGVALIYNGNTYNFIANYYGGTGNDLVLEWAGSRGRGIGDNRSGQLVTGTTVSPSLPVTIAAGMRALGSGAGHDLYLLSDGTLKAAGSNQEGELGDGTNTDRLQLVTVASGVSAVAAGYGYSMFVKTDGTLWATGNNAVGQLGDGTNTNRSSPVQVATGITAVAVGWYHSLFIKTDGTLWATGHNEFGQLGDGTNTYRNTPIPVASDVSAIACGSTHSLFLKSDGTLWTMGNDSHGQLGTGFGGTRATPVQIASGVRSVAAGQFHSLFVKTDGTLWAMGNNAMGQLGDGTNDNRGTPVQVATGVRVAAAGVEHSAFVKTDGTLWTFGSNELGQQGNGTTNPRNTPAQVLSNVVTVAAGAISRATLFIDAIAIPSITSPATASASYGATFAGYTVTASNAPTNFGASGLPAGLTINASTGAISGTPTASGTFAVTLSATNAGGTGTAKLTMTVNKAPLTVTADPKSRAVGAANPTFTATFSGFVNGDTVSVLSGAPALSTTATPGSGAGTYPIIVAAGNLAAANYSFTLVSGVLTVTGVSFSGWQEANFTAGELANAGVSGFAADADSDGLNNLLEYAFGLTAKVPDTANWPVLGTAGGALTLTYLRRNDTGDLTYTVEASNDLVTWTSGSSVTQETSTTVLDATRDQVLETDLTALSGVARRFLRLRVNHTSGAVAKTMPLGALRPTFNQGNRFTGMSLVNPAIARDVIASHTGSVLTLGYAGRNLGALLTTGVTYFVELSGGPAATYVGDRLEIDVAATKAAANNTLTLVAASTRSTLATLPANSGLAGYTVVVRPHVTLGQLFGTKTNQLMQGSTVLANADQVQFLNAQTQAFETYYFLRNASGSLVQWTKVGGGSTVQDALPIAPGTGMVVARNTSTPLTLAWLGEVRLHGSAQPLVAGNNLVSQALPIDSSPVQRALTFANGAKGSTVLASADQIQVSAAGVIQTYYLLRNASGSIDQWTRVGGGSTNHNNTVLFGADVGVVIRKVAADLHYYVPFYLSP